MLKKKKKSGETAQKQRGVCRAVVEGGVVARE